MAVVPPPSKRPAVSAVPDDQPSEPPAGLTDTADEAEMALPSDPHTFFLGGLISLGLPTALYVASSIILPVVLAFIFNLLFNLLSVS
jgi:hypothetical protein